MKIQNNKENRDRLKRMIDRAKRVLEKKEESRAKLYEKYIKNNFK
ncbi:hypothetical protein [Campylobacter mucosalis]|nr:hypothetical protein [Campylobacter mucosalis]